MTPTQPPPDNSLPTAVPGTATRAAAPIEEHLDYKDVIRAWKHYRSSTDIQAYINPVVYHAHIAYLCSEGTGVPIQDVKAIIHDFYGHEFE